MIYKLKVIVFLSNRIYKIYIYIDANNLLIMLKEF